MKNIIPFLIFLLFSAPLSSQPEGNIPYGKIDTTGLSIKSFAESITKVHGTDLDKAKTLLSYFSNNLLWVSTDYRQRTVKEILARGGGNCFEFAQVYMACLRALNIKYRPIAEINIQAYSESRQQNAADRIKKYGYKMSVFGARHNDHRWVEIFDPITKDWIPVDPTMNVFGTEQWLKARVWFGERITADTSATNSMIVPFAIFVTDSTRSEITESRSEHYLIEEFNNLYNGDLDLLRTWNQWKDLIRLLQEPARSAFDGQSNLHDFSRELSKLTVTYEDLKIEYQKNDREHQVKK